MINERVLKNIKNKTIVHLCPNCYFYWNGYKCIWCGLDKKETEKEIENLK